MEAALAASPSRKFLPSLGILLVAGGLLLLGWVAYSFLQPGPAPYRYQLAEEGGVERFAALGLEAWPDLKIGRYEIRVEGIDQPVAVGHVARRAAAAPVMLDWDNRSGEPLVFADTRLAEVKVLAQAIAKHTPKDALVLGWWDTSRQLRLLAGRETAFDTHLGEPLIAPAPWQGRNRPIAKYERAFWGSSPEAAETQRFHRFAEALTADAATGAAMLRELSGKREAYIVVHVADLYKLGLLHPDRLGIAYKDFPVKGDMHGPIAFVKRWMLDKKYSAYTLHELSESQARVYFLTDERSGNTLLAQTLPLTTSRPAELEALQLVYQHGGYWVYKIPASDG
ncbi:MAG: hydroxylamine oxidation protein HaoB [Zoogloeaceae bacterium]|nr:hydroxylamine oxidation protein HaoB [Zoogloeaceae bacterium]MCK6383437.1 hydroxylamine oxidation protein HaoB [Rhodocyclaceae bacterium]